MSEEVLCPLCGTPNPGKMVTGLFGELLGCDACLTIENADAWHRKNEARWKRRMNHAEQEDEYDG